MNDWMLGILLRSPYLRTSRGGSWGNRVRGPDGSYSASIVLCLESIIYVVRNFTIDCLELFGPDGIGERLSLTVCQLPRLNESHQTWTGLFKAPSTERTTVACARCLH